MNEKIDYKGYTIEIQQDDDAQSPAECSDTGLFLVSGHRDFYVMPPGEKSRSLSWAEIESQYAGTHWIFPIEAYIHSGVRLAFSRTGNFPDRQWDVSQVGAIFVAKKEYRLSKSARKVADSLLESWNTYLSGDVWGYVVTSPDGKEDSCWGFYGHEYCLTEAKSLVDSTIKHDTQLAAQPNECSML